MATPPFALSIHHFISSVGADAGFAAIIGLAILVLLYFAHAREMASLRRRTEDAEDMVQQLAAHIDQVSRSRGVAPAPASAQTAPAPAPASARMPARAAGAPAASRAASPAPASAAAAGGGVATLPSAPAGVGAPALSSATRLIPLGYENEISIRPLKNGNGDHGDEPAADGVSAPGPSTAAGGANGGSRSAAPAPAPAAAAGPPAAALAADEPAPRRALREPGAPGRPAAPPRFNDPMPRLSRFNPLAVAIAVAVAIVVIVVILVVAINSGGSSSASSSAASSRAAKAASHRHRAAAAVNPASVTVAVLNGTSTSHLAKTIMTKLNGVGYKPGAMTNASNQNEPKTIVGYTTPAARRDALAVAKSLGVGASAVQPVGAGDRGIACKGAATCPAQVVVTVGADLASSASGGASSASGASGSGATGTGTSAAPAGATTAG